MKSTFAYGDLLHSDLMYFKTLEDALYVYEVECHDTAAKREKDGAFYVSKSGTPISLTYDELLRGTHDFNYVSQVSGDDGRTVLVGGDSEYRMSGKLHHMSATH